MRYSEIVNEQKHYNEKKADRFDEEHNRQWDNPALRRGLTDATKQWLKNNPETTTSWYPKPIYLDPKQLGQLPGYRNEHQYLDQPEHQQRVRKMARDIEGGFFEWSPVMIWVLPNKGPVVYEGNHRVRAAIKSGLDIKIPVEWSWKGGTDLTDRWHPVMFGVR